MDEQERQKQKLSAPDADGWNKQMYRIRVFDELVYDTDPNLTNVLIGEDWKIWRVDFSRGSRLSKDLKDASVDPFGGGQHGRGSGSQTAPAAVSARQRAKA